MPVYTFRLSGYCCVWAYHPGSVIHTGAPSCVYPEKINVIINCFRYQGNVYVCVCVFSSTLFRTDHASLPLSAYCRLWAHHQRAGGRSTSRQLFSTLSVRTSAVLAVFRIPRERVRPSLFPSSTLGSKISIQYPRHGGSPLPWVLPLCEKSCCDVHHTADRARRAQPKLFYRHQ